MLTHNYTHWTMSVSCGFGRNTATEAISRKKGLIWLTIRRGKSIIVEKSKREFEAISHIHRQELLILSTLYTYTVQDPLPNKGVPHNEKVFFASIM